MAGLYIHIPFCKQACHYCDFHFSTNLKQVDDMVNAIAWEMKLQKDYLDKNSLKTIYFGGGTPSLLEQRHFNQIFDSIHKFFHVVPDCEVTVEANPDDLTPGKLRTLKNVGVNRLSIGIQSFDDVVLQFLNRAHDSKSALTCIDNARSAGIDNLSIDLIYAIPAQDHKAWIRNIDTALQLAPQHFSAYSLTIEEKTVFGNWLSKNKLQEVSDEESAIQFEILMKKLTVAGYEHYEISNFCLPGFQSRHNSSYWRQEPYLGIGPSAHSYNKISRQFTSKNNALYIRSIQEKKVPYEMEVLTRANKINEFILTTLRTNWGCDISYLKNEYEYDLISEKADYIADLQRNNLVLIQDQVILLTRKGKLLADKIASDFFAED